MSSQISKLRKLLTSPEFFVWPDQVNWLIWVNGSTPLNCCKTQAQVWVCSWWKSCRGAKKECKRRSWLPHMCSRATAPSRGFILTDIPTRNECNMISISAEGAAADRAWRDGGLTGREDKQFPEMISTWFWWELKPHCPFFSLCQKTICSHGNQQPTLCFHSRRFFFFLVCCAAGWIHLCVDRF